MFKTNEIRKSHLDRTSPARTGTVPADRATRQRLLDLGAKALSPAEILSLILGSGGAEASCVAAARLLARHGTLEVLARMEPGLLCREDGLGPARASRLAAAFELAARTRPPGGPVGESVRKPEDLLPRLREAFRGCDREHFLSVHLDARHRVTAVETVSIGCLDASLVHPREVFRAAIRRGTAALIAAHNHPSGCAEPSRDDRELTRRLAECGRLLGIELLDHIIVGDDEHTSLRESGWPAS